MPHMVETMAYAGEVPWHGLGSRVSKDLTPTEMMQKAGVNWRVNEADCYVEYKGGIMKTGKKSLIRSDTGAILSNVGKDWHTVQNAEAFAFFNDYVRAGDMEMHTAGSLKGGRVVWALAKVKETFDIFDGDQVDSYLLFSNPHEYGKAIDVRFTPIRVVCNNTLTLSLSSHSDRAVRIDHSTAFDADGVKKILGLSKAKFAEYKKMAKLLGSRPYSRDELVRYYNEVFPSTSRDIDSTEAKVNADGSEGLAADARGKITGNAKRCLDLLERQPGGEFAPGSWWQAFNSVTYFTDHVQGRNAENRLHSQWYGVNQRRKIKAAELAVKYAKAA